MFLCKGKLYQVLKKKNKKSHTNAENQDWHSVFQELKKTEDFSIHSYLQASNSKICYEPDNFWVIFHHYQLSQLIVRL